MRHESAGHDYRGGDMTEAQWRKLQLRLRRELRHRKLVNLLLWEDLDGSIHIRVVEGKTETIPN